MNNIKMEYHIEFLDYKNDDRELHLAEVIPFIYKDQINNARASDIDGEKIMILYDISIKFHEYLCHNFGIIYGILENDMVTICVIVNKKDSYLKYIKIINPIMTFLDLNTDILALITKILEFKDQLNLRLSCKIIKENITFHNYENSNLIQKLGKLIKDCTIVVNDIIPEKCIMKKICNIHNNEQDCRYTCYNDRHYFYSTNGIYSDVKGINLAKTINYKFSSYHNFKLLNKEYTMKTLIDNMDFVKSLQFLIDLLKFDVDLRDKSKSFTLKDKKLINQYDLSDHYHKTNDCYFKFNKDLKKFFDHSEWFLVVKNIICGNKDINSSLEELISNIIPIIDFGKKVDENYDHVKAKLIRCKRFYHNEGKLAAHYDDY